MSFTAKLFSFEGRIGRRDYWLFSLLLTAIMAAIYVALFAAFAPPAQALDAAGKPVGPVPAARDFGGFLLLLLTPPLLMLWPNLALQTKRWHDRDKGAVWLLMNLAPYVGPMWVLVELGFLPGTPGANRFGAPDGGLERLAAVFDDEIASAEDRAEAAIARWRSQPETQPAPQPSWTPAAPGAPGGFGRRGLSVA